MNNIDIFITVFTPTYNRANTLGRVYKSLCEQTYKNFEWIIVDDGSTDNTKEIVNGFIKNSKFVIKYYYQNNSGKHNAINRAVELANGSMMVIADSDDSFLPESFKVLLKYWNMASASEKANLKGITCRCISENGNLIGNKNIDDPYMDVCELDIRFKYDLGYEMWGMVRVDVLKEYPFPNIEGLRFYPECIIWNRIARKYKTRYINKGLRMYFQDQENATMHSQSSSRAKENYFMWKHYLNEVSDYFKYDPKLFIKSAVGIVRDGVLTKRTIGSIFKDLNVFSMKCLTAIFMPVGMVLAYKVRKSL